MPDFINACGSRQNQRQRRLSQSAHRQFQVKLSIKHRDCCDTDLVDVVCINLANDAAINLIDSDDDTDLLPW